MEQVERRPVLILGLGNPLRGDDGFGPAVVEALSRLDLPAGVEVLDGGTAGLGLLPTIAGRERLLVVDVAEMGRPAGSLAHFRWPEVGLAGSASTLSLHQAGLAEVLALAERLGWAPKEVHIFALQPVSLGWQKGLSRPAREKVTEAVAAILAEVSRVPAEPCEV
ncbi:MAG: hydrogenase maturation protease [Chloroflexia bacterium]